MARAVNEPRIAAYTRRMYENRASENRQEEASQDRSGNKPFFSQETPLLQDIAYSEAGQETLHVVVPPIQAEEQDTLPQEQVMLYDTVEKENGVNRRDFNREALRAVGTALFMPQDLLPLKPYERLAMVLKKPATIEESALSEFETITKNYWGLRTNIASSDLLHGVLGHLETVTRLLHGSLPFATHSRLCTIAGETCQIVGQIFFDMHVYSAALIYYNVSIDAAQEANNHFLLAVGLGRMSFLRTYGGQPETALPLLQEAQRLAAQSATITTRSWLAAIEAEVYANLGDPNACHRALERAEPVVHQKYGAIEEDPYKIGFNPSRLAGYKGVCFVRLHQPEAARASLKDALTLMHPLPLRRQSTILTDMAATYVQQGEFDEACQLASQALAITVQTKSATVLERISNLRQNLQAWEATPSVKNLDEHIAILRVRLAHQGNL